jgi:hypothetical protein
MGTFPYDGLGRCAGMALVASAVVGGGAALWQLGLQRRQLHDQQEVTRLRRSSPSGSRPTMSMSNRECSMAKRLGYRPCPLGSKCWFRESWSLTIRGGLSVRWHARSRRLN